MVALPLVLPMWWKNLPPVFSTATETVADLSNKWISRPEYQPLNHRLDHMAAEVPLPKRASEYLAPAPGMSVQSPITCNQPLPTIGKPLEYVNIFVDNFVLLGKTPNT